MAKKKSSYAAKHQQESTIFSWAEENADLWQIFKEPYNFEKIFIQLPYERQMEFLRITQAIQRDKFNIATPQKRKTLQYAADVFFEKMQWMTDSYYEEGEGFYPLADDERRLVRMECYGTIDARKQHQLSVCYKYFTSLEGKGRKKFKLKDYDLASAPMWRVFRQFESFRNIEPKLKQYLWKKRINPDALKVMSVSDYCDALYHTFTTNPKSSKATILKTPIKNKFVMDFMKHCGTQFEEYLRQKNIDERLVYSLCLAMKRFGVCDPNSISVIDTNFTSQILSDLKKGGYDISAYTIGQKIPQELIDDVIDQDKGCLLAARDEKGILISKLSLPKFEVHHTDGVQFAHSTSGGKMYYEKYLAQTNYPNKLMLVESEMHHLFYHGYDSVIRTTNNTECYYSRLNSNNPFLVMINGFGEKDHMYYDMENNARFRRREKEDKENVVNFFEMQLERLDNIKTITAKYNISHSPTHLKQEIDEIHSIIGMDSDVSGDIVKGLNKWLRSLKKADKNGVSALTIEGKGRE
ncbi:MAG: hypothetical protein J6Y91_05425 [Alphaproteobacteria bacterium]|nr:hypothetical protein [Alphaproteobacteria bacterium]